MDKTPIPLRCFLAEKDDVLIASFIGPITRASFHLLESAVRDILGNNARSVVLSFHDVPYCDRSVSAPAGRLAEELRRRGRDVRFCFLQPSLRILFTEERVAQAGEIANNLADALSGLPLSEAA